MPARFAARTRYLNINETGDLVLVQDFVDGPTLRKVLKDGTADLANRLGFAAHLTRGVAALHQHAVAHRDLKPENVILRGGREPVLIDLGLAALMGSSDVFPGMGTPGLCAAGAVEGRHRPEGLRQRGRLCARPCHRGTRRRAAARQSLDVAPDGALPPRCRPRSRYRWRLAQDAGSA